MEREIIIVRSLAESDLGLFAAHRVFAKSKQRAININSNVARTLLAGKVYKRGHVDLRCICSFAGSENRELRRFGKSHKNWRLGGKKIQGDEYASLDAKDFVLMRSVVPNDGRHSITLTFICKKTDQVIHAGVGAMIGSRLSGSMAVLESKSLNFNEIAAYCPALTWIDDVSRISEDKHKKADILTPMPADEEIVPNKRRTVSEKLKSPHILEHMLKVSGDLSAPAQLRFIETIDKLATQLRVILLETHGIIQVKRNHQEFWKSIKGQRVGFVDGGLANLSMLGSAPIAARVGGYTVVPGKRGEDRESFVVLKHLINELYAVEGKGIYDNSFPDIGALRDAARISVEAAGAVKLLKEYPDLKWMLLHGALVNPVSRYSDVMQDGKVLHPFPSFSQSALSDLLPSGTEIPQGRDRNFISVHLKQLQLLRDSNIVVCGVIERESTTTSVCRAILDNLQDEQIQDLLPEPPSQWKQWFRSVLDPSDDEEFEGQRITDSLLLRCVLEPGEALAPVEIDRNELRRAPDAWKEIIGLYPKPLVSYLQVNEWSSPVRIEFFKKSREDFERIAALILHCALLLPRYAFPVGLDIVDKFARIPNWMSRPINTHTTVRAMRTALDRGDERLFDSLRRMLCGSSREFLLRPNLFR